MSRQRIAMLVVIAAATGYLLLTGRHCGISSAVAARAVSVEPATWVGISGDVRFPGLFPIGVNNMTTTAILLTEPYCSLSPNLSMPNSPLGGRVRVVCPQPPGDAVIEYLPLAVNEQLLLNIPLDLNRVTAAHLEKIPGIGPVMAERIIQSRQKNGGFSSVSELNMVEGIGDATVRRLSRYLQVVDTKRKY